MGEKDTASAQLTATRAETAPRAQACPPVPVKQHVRAICPSPKVPSHSVPVSRPGGRAGVEVSAKVLPPARGGGPCSLGLAHSTNLS